MSDQPVTYLLVGAGNRGQGYAKFCEQLPHRARVVAVAEPRDYPRSLIAARHGLPPERVFRCWSEAAAAPKLADAVIIATQDALHEEPARAFAAKGYHLLLEKPMAPSEAGCRAIVEAVRDSGVMMAVCHVLRYTAYTRQLKALLAGGAVGDVISVQHVEPVGYWHQAHSFVRGNWRNEQQSTFMLMAKSCHDLDWLAYVMDRPCAAVSSFGRLSHFRPAHRPAGAADRCLDCAVESQCPYSARKIYLGFLRKGIQGWPLEVLTDDVSEAGVLAALRDGPYGRCVYACDNDVVDHQVVNFEFAGGATAVFTMTAFSAAGGGRVTRIFGTRGEIWGDSRHIKVRDFLTDQERSIDTEAGDQSILGGHGGGDGGLMDAFTAAVAEGRPERIHSGVDASWSSHQLVFAAERSRRSGQVVRLGDCG
jgi:predicted dehydrogenase